MRVINQAISLQSSLYRLQMPAHKVIQSLFSFYKKVVRHKRKTQNSHPQQSATNDKEKSTSSQGQGKQASKEVPVLKKATLEMMRKDWRKQQQRERQMNNKSSSPNTNKQNKNDKSQKQSTNKHVTSNREQKGSKDEIQLHSKFESLSDESDMEFVDSIDHPRAGSSKTWSPILPP